MKHATTVVLLLSILVASPAFVLGAGTSVACGASGLKVAFSPAGGDTQLVTDTIGKAKKKILVQAYLFTNATIARALASAKARGVNVRVILDKSQETDRYSAATYFKNHAIPVLIDDKHAIAHNKVMVIDGSTVITGSFNFTQTAETNNAENVLVIPCANLAANYARNWAVHAAHSVKY